MSAPSPSAIAFPVGRKGRPITAMSAVLLPWSADGPDWPAFEAYAERTVAAGLVPAVAMDTSYGPLLDDADRARAIAVGAAMAPGGFVAGAHVDDAPGDDLDTDAYRAAALAIAAAGGTPILFPSHGLAAADDDAVLALHVAVGGEVDRFLGFELGRAFHPAGRIYDLDLFEALLAIPALVGAKHSSLRRRPELDRLAVRDRRRPDFLVLTGNDLAIDLVAWGSDYLLGLSTFAPEAFAGRDRLLAAGDPAWWELNGALQAIGSVAFRAPVPAYRHDAAIVAHHRGWATTSDVHPASPRRPAGEAELLVPLLDHLDVVLAEVDLCP